MPDDLRQAENPYASPGCPGGVGIGIGERFRPTFAPVDLFDIVIGVVNSLLALAVLFGIPFLIVVVPGWAEPFIEVLAVVPGLLWGLWAFSRMVSAVSVDGAGLHFHLVFGGSEDWPWETVLAVRPATRWEVAWEGWIRPLLNPRERTSCMSTWGHYRIQGKTDYRFFPPKTPEAFIEAVARYRPDLLQPLK